MEIKSDDKELFAKNLIACCGGIHNIADIMCCATRLRLELKDSKLFNESEILLYSEVVGVLYRNGQPQIIMGLTAVDYYNEIKNLF